MKSRPATNSRAEEPPPHDGEAEAGALGCILRAENGEAQQMLDKLRLDHFSDLRHQNILRTLNALKGDGKTLDEVSLAQRLKDGGGMERTGGLAYVASLPDSTPSPANFPFFLDIIEDRAVRRAAIRDAAQLCAIARDLSTGPQAVADAARRFAEGYAAKAHGRPPAVIDATDFVATDMPEPPQLIWGILHRGCKLAIGGGSKTFKTWNFIDGALSVSHHQPWLGFKTTRAKVLYVNLELPAWSLHKRIVAVAGEKRIEIEPGWLEIWNLRGHALCYADLFPRITERIRGRDFGLIIIDPIYKLYGQTDENSARDVGGLLNQLELLGRQSGASTAFAAHFAKGNAAGKESIDRISGSGVFARDPDAILTFTRHETEGAFVVDSTLRNCKGVEAFVVRWQYPLLRRDDQLDPAKLKQAKPTGRTATYSVDMLIAALGRRKLTTAEWQKICANEKGVTRPTFYRLLPDLERAGLATKNKNGRWQVSKVSKAPSETSESIKSHNPLGYETDTNSKSDVSEMAVR